MIDRTLIAYGLILLLAAEFVGVGWWLFYHSRRRTDARERARRREEELAARVALRAAHGADAAGKSR